MWYLENNKITEYQAGFRNKRSPIDHLVRLEMHIPEAYIKKKKLVAIFFFTWKRCMIPRGSMG